MSAICGITSLIQQALIFPYRLIGRKGCVIQLGLRDLVPCKECPGERDSQTGATMAAVRSERDTDIR